MTIFEKNLLKSFRYCYSGELLMFIQKVTIIKCTTLRHSPLQKKPFKRNAYLHNKIYIYDLCAEGSM